MKVLHVYRTYFPETQGGLEEVIRQICAGTKRFGVSSRVFTTSPMPSKALVQLEECDVAQCRSDFEIASCNISLTGLRQFKQQVEWCDIVHYHFPWPFGDYLHFAASVDKPSLVTYHSDIVRQKLLGMFYRPLMNRFLASVDRIVCTSPNYFATSNVLSKFSDKVRVIPIGIKTPEHLDGSPNEDIENQYGSDFFLFVGVLRYYKGLHILLDAIKGAPYEVVLVGSGPIEAGLRAQAKKLGLTNVKFAGYVSDTDKHEFFRLARGVVFPSYLRAEAFGVTLLEGAMHSKPMISTEVGSGTSHVNVHGETGFVVPPGSHRVLRKAMDQLWSNPDLAVHFGRQARERYIKLFSGDVMGTRYAAIYAELLGLAPPVEMPNKLIGITSR